MTLSPRPRQPRAIVTNFPAERAVAIGSRLRQIYDEAVAEPLPDAFTELLRKLG